MKYLAGKVVLVTGANGFVGTHLVRRLQEETSSRLVLLSRHRPNAREPNCAWVISPLELLSSRTWPDNGIEHIDVIFHLGAFTPKSPDEANCIDRVYRGNLLGTRALLESLPSTPEKIVFASTIDVYARSAETVLNESSPLGPATLYGASKLFCERLVALYGRMHGCGYAILRYGHLFGPGEDAYRKLIPEAIRALVGGDEPVVYGAGRAERDFLYVEDAVEATVRAGGPAVGEVGPLNVVRGAAVSVVNVIETLVRITGFKGKIKYAPGAPTGESRRFDSTRMHVTLGQWPLVPLEEGLRKEVEWFRQLAKR